MEKDSWSNEIHLRPHQILRFKCTEETSLIMTNGLSEIYGSEFPLDNVITLPINFEGSLVTFIGCSYRYKASDFPHYIINFDEDSFCYNIYLNIHNGLEKKRNECSSNGPRVMICGNRNAGKKNLSQILVNYRIRSFSEILLVDINVSDNCICIPGSLAALVVTQVYHVTDGWHINDQPLVLNFGHLSPMDDLEMFKFQLKSLSEFVNDKLKNNAKLNRSGLILNSSAFEDVSYPEMTRDQRATLFLENINLFKIDHVIVIGDLFLEKQIKDKLNSNVTIVSIPRSAEAFPRTETTLFEYYKMKTSSYFKGQGIYKLHLKSFTLFSQDVSIYKFDEDNEETEMKFKNPKLMKISRYFKNSILAISQTTKVEDLSRIPIYGYVMITDVYRNLEKFKILTPAGQPIPSKIFLFTHFKMIL